MGKRKAAIFSLVPTNDAQRRSAIALLKDVLAQAEAGDIEQAGVAFVRRGGIVGSAHSDGYAGQLLGASFILSSRLAKAIE